MIHKNTSSRSVHAILNLSFCFDVLDMGACELILRSTAFGNVLEEKFFREKCNRRPVRLSVACFFKYEYGVRLEQHNTIILKNPENLRSFKNFVVDAGITLFPKQRYSNGRQRTLFIIFDESEIKPSILCSRKNYLTTLPLAELLAGIIMKFCRRMNG